MEKLVLETVRVMAERFKPELLDVFRWPADGISRDSPLQVGERDAEDQFRTWLKLWPAHCTVMRPASIQSMTPVSGLAAKTPSKLESEPPPTNVQPTP